MYRYCVGKHFTRRVLPVHIGSYRPYCSTGVGCNAAKSNTSSYCRNAVAHVGMLLCYVAHAWYSYQYHTIACAASTYSTRSRCMYTPRIHVLQYCVQVTVMVYMSELLPIGHTAPLPRVLLVYTHCLLYMKHAGILASTTTINLLCRYCAVPSNQ